MRRRFAVVVVVGVVAVVGMVVPATGAQAAKAPGVVCGQVITTDVVLGADLTCSGDALVIGASGVTVRLAGHTITSTDGTGMGIRLSPLPSPPGTVTCVRDVVIRDGTITGFFAAIGTGSCRSSVGPADPLSGGRVAGMTLVDNTWGVFTTHWYLLAVDRTTIVGPNGIGGPFSPGAATGSVEVTASRIRVTSTDGFSVLAAVGARSSVASSRLEGGRAIGIDGFLTISASRLDGVTVSCGDGSLAVTDNRLEGGTVTGGVCGTTVSGNRFVGPGSGSAVDAHGGLYPTAITDNVFTGWDTAVVAGSYSTTITGNTFRSNGTGVSCAAYCGGTASGNRFRDNAGTGLELRIGTWHVGTNVAVGNGGLGIDAQGPTLTVIDDGGNVARRNQPPQCIGVVCTTHP